MMQTRQDWAQLALETLRDPKATAIRILSWDVPRNLVYLALLTVAAVSGVISGVAGFLIPSPAPEPPLLANPLSFAVLVALGVVVSAHLFLWAGRAMGGTGSYDDVLVLLVWLQALRTAAQVIVVFVGLLVPALGLMIAFAISILGLWLLVHFLNVSMRYDSLTHAAGLLIAVIVGLVVGLMLLITLIGATNLGLTV